jgi:glutamine synthetase
VLNVVVADALDSIATELEKATANGEELSTAVATLLTKVIKEHKRIVFNGNNYAETWQKEAARRGLLNLRDTVDALPQLVAPAVVKIFEKHKVLSERELHARYDVNLETYTKTINIEAQLMVMMANRYILPSALTYQKQIAESVAAVKAAGGQTREGKKLLTRFTRLLDQFKAQADSLSGLLEHTASSAEKHAKHMRDKVIPAMTALREQGDELELFVPHELWPLPTYREMLFIK